MMNSTWSNLYSMKFSRFFILLFVTYLFLSWFGLVAAYAQDEEVEVIELLTPNYVSADYGFGMFIPDGYIAADFIDEEIGAWTLNILGEMDQPSSILNVEPLPDDVTDVAAYWQFLKDRDQYMERNITYEKVDSIAGVGAIQARIEGMEVNQYLLAITWVFVKDGHGFMLSSYPPIGGNNSLARDFSLTMTDQFRWMSPEEIEASEVEEFDPTMPGGEDF